MAKSKTKIKTAKAKPKKAVKAVKKSVKPAKVKVAKKPVKKAPVKSAAKTKTVKKPAAPKSVTVVRKKEIKQPAKKVKKYKKNSKIRYTTKELQHFKYILTDEKQKIIDSARANMMSLVDSESGDYVGDDLSYASHMAEQGTDEMEREKNYMFVQRDEKYLGYIEEALTRIDQGTYGVCIDCIDEPKNLCSTCPLIPKERLEIVPITQHCIECKNLRG